jgi:hypothetical protein
MRRWDQWLFCCKGLFYSWCKCMFQDDLITWKDTFTMHLGWELVLGH